MQDYRFAFGSGHFVGHHGLGFVDLYAALEELDAGQDADAVFCRLEGGGLGGFGFGGAGLQLGDDGGGLVGEGAFEAARVHGGGHVIVSDAVGHGGVRVRKQGDRRGSNLHVAGAVGGAIMPIDMTSLFVAGAMTNAFWVLPTLGGIAGATIAIFKIKRRHC